MGHPTAIFLTPPDPNYKCAICLDIFEDPVSLLRCGHTFCRLCLETSLEQSPHNNDEDSDDESVAQTGGNCPECRAKIDVSGDSSSKGRSGKNRSSTSTEQDGDNSDVNGNIIHSVRVIESAIGNSIVRCKNTHLEGEDVDPQQCVACSWTGKLCEWPIHAARECSIEIISCPVSGCSHKCSRADMRKHTGSKACINNAVKSKVEEKMELFRTAAEEEWKKEATRLVKKLERRLFEVKVEKDVLEACMEGESEKRRKLEKENLIMRREMQKLSKSNQALVEEQE